MKKSILALLPLISLLTISARTIHIFGDSHAAFCFSNERRTIPRDENSIFNYNGISIPFSIHWFGSKTMHSIGRDGLAAFNLKNFGMQDDDVAVFVFGEIDARCHIGKQRDIHNRKLDEIVTTLAQNFLKTVKENIQLLSNVPCVIVSIIPPTNNVFNEVYPYHGSLEDRVTITQLLNRCLKEHCLNNSIAFLDIYSLYANDQGALDNNHSDGVVHVNAQENDLIKQHLIELLNLKYQLFLPE